MHYSTLAILAISAHVSAHGVITSITGANGVTMPGLSVIDGTPRDCASPACGAEADTSIIRAGGSPLGKTNGGGTVDAASAIAKFMGGSAAASAPAASTSKAATKATKATKRSPKKAKKAKAAKAANKKRAGGLAGLLGGGGGAAGGAGASGATSAGVKTAAGTTENGVSKAAGTGASSGMPTVGADGKIQMTFHQVNQDGAGPLTASIDPTSGGTDEAAFQSAVVNTNVPGIGIGGLSGATTTDFPVEVQMPAGMTCTGSAGGATNICVAKLQNSALAGPFGGSVAFTQSPAAVKRAEQYNRLKAKRFAYALDDEDFEIEEEDDD